MALARLIRPVHVESILSTGARAASREQTVPDVARAGRQVVAGEFCAARCIVERHLDARGVAGEDREIDAVFGPRRTQGSWQTRLK